MENLTALQAQLENWWNFGEQERPCFLITLPPPPDAAIPDTDDLERWWMDVDFILDRQMKLMEAQKHYGVSVPFQYVDRGSSAMEGILGANMKFIDKQTIWAYPCFNSVEQAAAEVAADPNNIWRTSTLEITRRSVALAKDHHFVAPYAMEGVSDILSGLYGTENLLMDMVEKPAAVGLALERIKRLWIELWGEIQGILASNRELRRDRLGGHLGAGDDLPHAGRLHLHDLGAHVPPVLHPPHRRYAGRDGLRLLSSRRRRRHPASAAPPRPEQAARHSVGAGTGKEELAQWHELIARILAAGKSVEVFARPEEVEPLVKAVGARGLLINVSCSAEEAERLVS